MRNERPWSKGRSARQEPAGRRGRQSRSPPRKCGHSMPGPRTRRRYRRPSSRLAPPRVVAILTDHLHRLGGGAEPRGAIQFDQLLDREPAVLDHVLLQHRQELSESLRCSPPARPRSGIADQLDGGSRRICALAAAFVVWLIIASVLADFALPPGGLPAACSVTASSPEMPVPISRAAWPPAALAALTAREPSDSDRSVPVLVVLASNLPALAVQPLLPTLALRRPVLLKSPSSEPLFAPAFLAALTRRETRLAGAVAAATWPGGDAELEAPLLAAARAGLAHRAPEAPAHPAPPAAGERFGGYGPEI